MKKTLSFAVVFGVAVIGLGLMTGCQKQETTATPDMPATNAPAAPAPAPATPAPDMPATNAVPATPSTNAPAQ